MEGDDFQCEHCGLLLDPEQASGEYIITEPTIVRALLSPPQRSRTMEVPRPPPQRPAAHDLATARFTVPMDANTVPHLRAGLDIALQPLHPFEAHIASFVDGVHAVPQLALAARLPEIEVKVVLKALLERGVLELHRAPVSPPRRSRTEELPLLDGSEFLTPEAPGFDDLEPSTLQEEDAPTLVGERPAMLMALGAEEDDLSPMALGDEEPLTHPAPRPPRATAPGERPRPSAPPTSRPQPTRNMRPAVGQASSPGAVAEHVTHPSTPAPPPRAPQAPPPLPATSRTGPAPATRGGPGGLGGSSRVVAPLSVTAPAVAPLPPRPAPAPRLTASSAPTLPAAPFPSTASPTPAAPERAPRPARPTLPLDAPVPVSATEDFLQRAVRLERGGHVDRAIEVLTKAIDQAPEAAALHSKLALILVHQRKDYLRAAKLLERAVELEPGNTVFQQNLLKVTGLAAASAGERKDRGKPGLFARLTGKRS
ncbi:tetratricopeptide repeat protein [Myxococcus eversor]|uniref:tetratricopeptide repeat protein n=1 Tax=Myxococcus eversor TaxID=2709661 RepID=UPI001F07487B|nr:tetratricopeptide repeat protein [Myxococcus eversor]